MTQGDATPPGVERPTVKAEPLRSAKDWVGRANVLWLTFDTLRYDVAKEAMDQGQTPFLSALLPQGWEARHSPGSFTFAAHQAFFAGFLPTPPGEPRAQRTFALRFGGSETTGERSWVFDAPNVAAGFASQGYRTLCLGGTGFFNPASPLGGVLPALFNESHFEPSFGVTSPTSTQAQVNYACRWLEQLAEDERFFLFINLSAMHQPNYFYLADPAEGEPAAREDSPASQQAALAYVDGQLPTLIDAIRARGPAIAMMCSDHGTLYGESGHVGHRVAHPAVWTVPYAEMLIR